MGLFTIAAWDWVVETINYLLLVISSWIYVLIGWLYQVFSAVARVNIFSKDVFEKFTSRMYVVVAIAMLVIFAYNIILMIVNPDNKKGSGSQMGKMVKETIFSLILVILLPTIFNWMYVFQNNIIDSNILGQIVLGPTGSTDIDPNDCVPNDFDCTCNFDNLRGINDYNRAERGFWGTLWRGMSTGGIGLIFDAILADFQANHINTALQKSCLNWRDEQSSGEKGANSIGPTILTAFYRPINFNYDQCIDYLYGDDSIITDDEDKKVCVNYFIDVNMSRYTGNIAMFVGDGFLRQKAVGDDQKLDFNGIMALIAGCLAVWMFLCYAMEIGVRVAKLGVLQLIAPIPVMMRIIPKQKEGIYDKWFKLLIDTYLDVFIRLIIIFFALFAVSLVPDALDALFSSMSTSSDNWVIKSLASVFVILGILKFAGDAPNLIKEFFGSSGKFALRSPKKQLEENKLAMGGIGAAAGMATSGMGNFVRARKEKLQEIKDDPSKEKHWYSGVGAGLKSGVAGMAAGGVRGFNEGEKVNDFANMSAAIDRAKAETDKKYFARRDRMEKREQFLDKYGSDFADKVGADKKGVVRDVASMIGAAFNKDTYTEAALGKVKETINSWAGSGAMSNAKRSANSEVKGYAATTMEALDSQTKGIVKSLEEQREQKVREARPDEVESIRKEYSKLIEKERVKTITLSEDGGMDAAAFDNFKKSIENLCDSLKNNQNYLEYFTGEDGALAKSISDIKDEMTPAFKKLFEGSLDEFSTGMKDIINNKDKFSALNDSDRTAIINMIDKSSKTADNNLRGIANEEKKQTDKK